MLTLLPVQESLRKARTHRFASLWRITRTDGIILRLTDHDCNLVYAGSTYEAGGSLKGTARQKLDGLRDRNFETAGVISSDSITFDDLRAGRYREAKIEHMLVDWRYPWAGPFETQTYWIVGTTFTGEVWQANVEGLTHRLKMGVGRVYGRTCDVKNFGDSRCGLDQDDFTETVQVVTAIERPRRSFFCTTLVGFADNNFKMGFVKFTSGANDNLKMEVVRSTNASGKVSLWIDMPYDIEIGDTFNIIRGCNRLFRTCRDTFNNVENFRGFPYIPGTDAMLKTPVFKQARAT